MKEFEYNGQQYLAVGMPNKAKDFKIGQYVNGYATAVLYKNPELKYCDIEAYRILPTGEYKVIGLVKDLGDGADIFSSLVQKHSLSHNDLILKYDKQPQQ